MWNVRMKLPGEVITKERVSVEIDKKALYRELTRQYTKKFLEPRSLDLEYDYIDSKTSKVMRYDGDNYHNGNPEYIEGRLATFSDVEAFRFKEVLSKILLE